MPRPAEPPMPPPPRDPDPPAPADAATAARPPDPPAAGDCDRTRTADGWRDAVPGTTQPAAPGPPASGPPSGQAIRHLDQWLHHNRHALDLGGYALDRPLGTGAFGAVWEAHDPDTGERVAVKFLSAGDDRWVAMLGEVKFLQALEGTPGIVTVKQVRRGTDHQPPYYVMPLAAGGSLADRIDAAKAADPGGRPVVPAAEAVRVFTRVAAALAAVHRRGIHHCDLKPRNVLLHRPDPAHPAEPLIADFGQAHLATDDTPALGTFFYMPPDQADAALRKARSDSSWDVYALGALVYELLTGDPPRKTAALVQTIKRTEHLGTKLAAYRDGVRAAPAPAAHRPLADPLLADVLDRCLAADPARRPRDAGEVVELLRRRAWWRQVRGPLAVGAAATVLVVLLIAGVSLYAGRMVYRNAAEEVAQEIDGSLTRTAWYGRGAVDRALRDHLAFIEEHADCDRGMKDRLAAAADRVHAAGPDGAYDAVGDRAAFDRWAAAVQADARRRWPGVAGRAVALVLVAGDTPAGGAPARGYTLTRADGVKPAGADRDNPAQSKNYRTDWSFRDYFTGAGNRFAAEGEPHPVVRHTHVSQTYQSRRDGVWRVELVSPVWSGAAAGEGRVVALLSVSLDVDGHLRQLIDMPDEVLGDGQAIGRAVTAYVVNDRGRWVWHEVGMKSLAADAAAGQTRDPHDLAALARDLAPARGLDPDDLVPWRSAAGMADGGDRYVDPVALHLANDARVLRSHVLTFTPYAHSRYEPIRGRVWGFVAQVPEGVALAPVDRLHRRLAWAGSILVAALAGLALILWGWLVRLLRGWEFAGHG